MKTQMKFQKWLCFAILLLGALAVVDALCYCSGGLAGIGTTIRQVSGEAVTRTDFTEASLFLDVQSFNDMLLYLGIALILLAVVLYLTATNKRRNYYVTNYIATGVVSIGNVAISVYVLIKNGGYMSRFINEILNNESAMAAYQKYAERNTEIGLAYSESTLMFILTIVLFALIIIASILLILNLVWKIKLMNGEKALLKNGLAKEAV